MSDPRLQQHKQFDIIRCKLCNRIYNEPRILSCLHSFCTKCLDKYVSTTTKPSENHFNCPVCNETIDLPATGGVQALLPNTVLIRFITQAQKDKTSVVAGREVLHMSCEALSESELKCPEIVASIQEIAHTAGHVLADNVEDENKQNDLESFKVRQDVQLKTTNIQVKAMDLVHCIDQVNISHREWENKRAQIRDAIKLRSSKIQDSIKMIERQLISRLEDRDIENELKNEAFAVKNTLHKTLQSSLSLVDFLRLLSEYGNKDEIDAFGSMAAKREESLHRKPVKITKYSFEFDSPQVDITEGLEMMFGSLSEITEETVVWDPKKPSYKVNTTDSGNQSFASSTLYTDETTPYTQNYTITEKYTEVNENGNSHESGNEQDVSDRYSRRQYTTQPNRNKRYAMPAKSLSFDASIPESPYNYITSENQDLYAQLLHVKNSNKGDNPQFQILNEQATDHSRTRSSNSDTDQRGSTSMQSAINTLEESSRWTEPAGKSWSRRLSAPPSVLLNSLNRRRLSALSILERSNISTEGLNVTSDIESGMNEARMEWLRDNLRRKTERRGSEEAV